MKDGGDRPLPLIHPSSFILSGEAGCEPVQQLRVARQRPVTAEIVRRIDQTAAEMVLPYSVNDGPPGQRVFGARDPFGKRSTPLSLVRELSHIEISRHARHTGKRARP